MQTITAAPKKENLEKLLRFLAEWTRPGDKDFEKVFKRIENCTVEYLLESKAFYHGDCYKKIVNTNKLERLRERSIITSRWG